MAGTDNRVWEANASDKAKGAVKAQTVGCPCGDRCWMKF